VAGRSVLVPMTLSDLESRNARGQFFQADLLNNARTVWRGTTKFDSITRVVEGRILRGPAATPPQGGGPSTSQYWVPFSLFISAYSLCRRTTKFDAVTYMGRGLVFRWWATAPSQRGRSPVFLNFWGSPVSMTTFFKEERPNLAW